MYTADIWRLLGIEPTASKRDIKRAYAAAIKNCHPEEKPEEYEQLKTAYEAALKSVEEESEVQGFPAIMQGTASEAKDSSKILPPEEERYEFLDKLEEFQDKKELSEFAQKVLDVFIRDFSDSKKRKDKNQWKEFFLREDFLRVQFEPYFVEQLNEYLQQQQFEDYCELPMTLVAELVIAYGLIPEDDNYIHTHGTWDGEGEAAEPCADIVADIWNAQSGQNSLLRGSSFLRKQENITRLNSFIDYHLLRNMAEHGYLVRERSPEWMKIVFAAREGNILLKNKSTTNGSFVPKRHECLLDLYEFLLENYEIPSDVCRQIYEDCELATAEQKVLAQKYMRMKEIILKKHPEIIELDVACDHEEDYLRVTRQLLNIQQKYCYYKWIVEPDDNVLRLGLVERKKNVPIRSEEEWKTVEELLHSEDFLRMASEYGFREKLFSTGLSYCSVLQLCRFYKDRGKDDRLVKRLLRWLEDYIAINDCMFDVGEAEEITLQGMKDEVLALFQELGADFKNLTKTAYNREECGSSIYQAEDFKKCERVDVSALTGEQKAAKMLEIMKKNREPLKAAAAEPRVIFPHLEELSDFYETDVRSEVEEKFEEKYGCIDNNYVILKYGTREAEITEKIVAMGIIRNQDDLYDVVGSNADDNAFDSQSCSVVRKAGDITYAVGWYWTVLYGMMPMMQGESQNFYGTRFITAKKLESFEKYLAHVLCLEYVTQIIVCEGSICVEYDL